MRRWMSDAASRRWRAYLALLCVAASSGCGSGLRWGPPTAQEIRHALGSASYVRISYCGRSVRIDDPPTIRKIADALSQDSRPYYARWECGCPPVELDITLKSGEWMQYEFHHGTLYWGTWRRDFGEQFEAVLLSSLEAKAPEGPDTAEQADDCSLGVGPHTRPPKQSPTASPLEPATTSAPLRLSFRPAQNRANHTDRGGSGPLDEGRFQQSHDRTADA